MLYGQSLWELVDKRVEETPDALLAVDEDMRTLTFAEFATESARAAAGLANYGVGEGSVVTWQLPTWLESLVLVGALSRLGAIQNPVLPIYREREVGFCTRQAGASLLVVPSEFGGFDFEAMATEIAQDVPGMQVLVADKQLPQGDTSALPPIEFTTAENEVPRWLFYTSGTTADPKGAQPHRPVRSRRWRGAWPSGWPRHHRGPTRNALVFPFTHIGGIGWLFTSAAVTGCSQHLRLDAFVPERSWSRSSAREGVTLGGSGHRVPPWCTSPRNSRAADGPIFPEVRGLPRAAALRSRPSWSLRHALEAFGAPVILSGYGLTEAPDPHDGDRSATPTRTSPTQRGQTGHARRGPQAGVKLEGERVPTSR